MDDGTPDQYDLPPPTTAGAVAPPVNGEAKANGQIIDSEDIRYSKERTGWAPRFEPKEAEDTGSETLIDHQTLLEGKLDDKFFGDWYHNTAVIIFACLASWVVAVLGGGLAWVFLIMAACGTYYRTSIRRVRRNYRDDVNREMAKQRLETDTESLEWINSFMAKFWPIYAPVLADSIIQSVDQVLSTSTPAFLDSLRMKTFILGTKPPRLEHVKTYPKADPDTVLMDWKFSFNPNDVMDLTARQIKDKQNPKVVLEVRIGKAMISKGLDVIVEDFAFSGLMRVKVKLQIPFPHVERIDICFLGRPEIDYVCKPLGGDTFGFDINFIPGLESFIQEQIHGNLAPIMYDPNVFPIEIAKMLSGNPVDQAIGVLAITLHGAQGLRNPDKFSGTPDPYAVISLASRTALGKTKIVRENANPRWNETIYVIISSFVDPLTIQLYDYNEFRKDKELGTATFPLEQVESEYEHENLQLEVKAGAKAHGNVQADVRFFPVLEGQKFEDGTEEPPPESKTGIARITIEQAKDLDGSKSLVGSLSPYAMLLLNGKEIHTTSKLKRTNNPIWGPSGSKEVLITDRKAARLGLIIKDDRDMTSDPLLGSYQIKLDDMITLQQKGQEWFNLSGAKTGRAKLSIQWKPVELKGVLGGSGGYVTPIGVMRLHLQSARGLRNVESMGKSDPYCRVLLSGIQKERTVTFENNLNPDWDEVLYIAMHHARERIVLEVMDEENLQKDRPLGQVELSAADYIFESNGEYQVHDQKTQKSEPLRMHGKGNPKGTLNFTCAFYPTIPVVDPEEEEADRLAAEEMASRPSMAESRKGHSVKGSLASVASTTGTVGKKSLEKDPVRAQNEKEREAGKISLELSKTLSSAQKEQEDELEKVEVPKIRLSSENLQEYGELCTSLEMGDCLLMNAESGLLVFKIIEGTFSSTDVQLELLLDQQVFPAYVSTKVRSTNMTFGDGTFPYHKTGASEGC